MYTDPNHIISYPSKGVITTLFYTTRRLDIFLVSQLWPNNSAHILLSRILCKDCLLRGCAVTEYLQRIRVSALSSHQMLGYGPTTSYLFWTIIDSHFTPPCRLQHAHYVITRVKITRYCYATCFKLVRMQCSSAPNAAVISTINIST